MMFHDQDDQFDEQFWVPTLGVVMVAAIACVVLFWLPLLLYVWHWWLR